MDIYQHFLIFLNYMPIGPITLNSNLIQGFEIPMDENVSEALGKL